MLPELRRERSAEGEPFEPTRVQLRPTSCSTSRRVDALMRRAPAAARRRSPPTSMKVLTVLGTRPEIIRLSRVIERLDAALRARRSSTPGRTSTRASATSSSSELGVRAPDVTSASRPSGFGEQVGQIIAARRARAPRASGRIALLVLGDTEQRPGRLRRQAARASRSSTWRPATAASTTACRRRSTAASSTTPATC